jgi:hypothetical protein
MAGWALFQLKFLASFCQQRLPVDNFLIDKKY